MYIVCWTYYRRHSYSIKDKNSFKTKERVKIVMDIYSLTEGKFIPQLNSVDNLFIRQLYMLAVNSAKNKKMVDKQGPFEYNIPCQKRTARQTNRIMGICIVVVR